MIGMMIPETGSASMGGIINQALNDMSSSPFNGQGIYLISEQGATGQMSLQWGLGQGGYYFVISGIIMAAAGILEIFARTIFFGTKIVEKPKKQKKKKDKENDKKYKKSEENKGMKPDIPKEEDNVEEIFD